jgi:hypothetical protein
MLGDAQPGAFARWHLDIFARRHFDVFARRHFDVELRCGLLYLRNSCHLHDQFAAGAMPPVWFAGPG